jgi:hypothetical protein
MGKMHVLHKALNGLVAMPRLLLCVLLAWLLLYALTLVGEHAGAATP